MNELWQVQVTAYCAMGRWHYAVVVWEPFGDGGAQSTKIAGGSFDWAEGPDPVADVLGVLEHAHCAVIDAAGEGDTGVSPPPWR
jgi:hypothetical protein